MICEGNRLFKFFYEILSFILSYTAHLMFFHILKFLQFFSQLFCNRMLASYAHCAQSNCQKNVTNGLVSVTIYLNC